MNIKQLTKEVEERTGSKINWELGKKYEAIDAETGKRVAVYNPKSGKLAINN